MIMGTRSFSKVNKACIRNAWKYMSAALGCYRVCHTAYETSPRRLSHLKPQTYHHFSTGTYHIAREVRYLQMNVISVR
jgi:hypothetical protein